MANTKIPVELSSTPGIVDGSNATAITIDSSENIGIGVTPSTIWSSSYDALQIGIGGSISAHSSAGDALKIGSNFVYEGTAPNYYDKYLTTSTAHKYELDADGHKWFYAASGTAGNAISWSEAMRIDSSGNVLVGATSNNNDAAGIGLNSTGFFYATRSGSLAASFNRLTDDGTIADFRRDGNVSGTLNSVVANRISLRAGSTAGYLGVGSTDYFAWNTTDFRPTADDSYDLGASGARFDDIYATNGTIQTSDQNEKNTITNSDLGLNFINRLSPKSYKFKLFYQT